ncbi:phage tail protein [Chloroflexia bacterium SDU3-3]|nr:phage tail protein [Chloroflexia bacterium SDU3-3]
MSDQFLGEIRMFAGNFAPVGWAFCNGQLMPISQNTALFSLLGTYYGGDGKSTFALPNLIGNVPIHQGQGPGLSEHYLGEASGTESVTLLTSEIPAHTHTTQAQSNPGGVNSPTNMAWAAQRSAANYISSANVNMAADALALAGGFQPHNNMQPYLVVTFIIALQGIFPPRG